MPFPRLDEGDFHHRIADTPGTSLVIVTGPHCGACRAWKRLLEEYQVSRTDELTIYEVDAQQDMGIARELGVFHLPALFLYRDGDFHCALQAEASLTALDEAIRLGLAAPAQDAP